MEKHKAIVLAGIFAVSNMGQKLPPIGDVVRVKANAKTTVNSSVMAFAQGYMETDEHQKIFEDEGRSWFKTLLPMDDNEAAKTWPDILALYDNA